MDLCREHLKTKRSEIINLELENFELRTELETFELEKDSGLNGGDGGTVAKSAPLSRRTSPVGSTETTRHSLNGKVDNNNKPFQLMQSMHKCIEDKSREVEQLKNMLEVSLPQSK